MKKILITGINGFIGSYCAKHFTSLGFEVFGIDVQGEGENFIQGEVSSENLKKLNQKFDIIIHLVGSGTVGMAQKAPENEYMKSVGSTHNILEYIKNYNQNAKLIYASSAAVYGDMYDKKIKEDDELNPISIYGKHKLEVEQLCKNYHNKFGLKINIIRFFSVYGQGLRKQLLWDFSNRFIQNKNAEKIDCFGTGNEMRDFVHISDAVQLIEILINTENTFGFYNCGSGEKTSVREVLENICREFGFNPILVFDNITQEGNPKNLLANISKAQNIGFIPNVNIKEGLKKYVKWFKQNN